MIRFFIPFLREYFPEIILGLVVLYQFAGIYFYSVDSIHIDEWAYLYPGRLDVQFNWDWLIAFHNEHRIMPTKFLAWINYNLNGLNFRFFTFQSYLVYVMYIASLYYLKILTHGRDTFKLFPIFLALLLSSSNYWNLIYGFQSCFHFVLLFSCGYLIWIYRSSSSFSFKSLGALALLFLINFSLGTGLVMSLALTGGALIISFILKTKNKIFAATLFGCSLVLAIFVISGVKVTQEVTLPYRWQFWHYLFQLIGAALGFDSHYRALPAGIFISLSLVAGFIFIYKTNRLAIFYPWILWIFAVGGSLATVAVGRASNLYTAMEPRFNELSLALIPGLVLLVWEVGKIGANWKKFSNAFLTVLVLMYLGKFGWDGFRKENELRTYYRQQIQEYLINQKTGFLYPMNDGRFEVPEEAVMHLKRLKIHFAEEILRKK